LGYISKAIALCGKKQLWDAMEAFDFAFAFSNSDPNIINLLLLIKVLSSLFLTVGLSHQDFNVIFSRLLHFSMPVATMKQCGEFKTSRLLLNIQIHLRPAL
jgi:hypothetical protein